MPDFDVLVTGSSGFLRSALIIRLSSYGLKQSELISLLPQLLIKLVRQVIAILFAASCSKTKSNMFYTPRHCINLISEVIPCWISSRQILSAQPFCLKGQLNYYRTYKASFSLAPQALLAVLLVRHLDLPVAIQVG